ncbi:N-acetylmuramoyl-L-alanine amidase [Hyphomicrobium sp. CS1BSMeth3]|uniref:N-acetylmuramoyl-L-alanine amidase n=1 Tax=Hyphomicrobium sp. CS1BSMeth3 TaxID=1892844 RepID=UPI0009312338|nr:N-acetylmuramoyl-L-alanine amidase [Hyphomicrobium sp. CS1BSMeth3]
MRLSAIVLAVAASMGAGGAGKAEAQTALAAAPTELAAATIPLPAAPAERLKKTRFVIALERKVEYQVQSLPNPNRVIVDLPNVKLRLPPSLAGQPVGIVNGFRAGLGAPGKMRVVIDVTEPVIVEKSEFLGSSGNGPVLLSLEIAPAATDMGSLVQAAASMPASAVQKASAGGTIQPPVPRPAERPDKRAANAYKPLIVLDPGHGGHDSGAIRNGTVEKEVVLAFARTLRDQLRATGHYRVALTREDDTFVPLEERRQFAEDRKAALFIAIHADYATSRARGATIYSLRESVASNLAASARRQSANDALSDSELSSLKSIGRQGPAVKSILADLAGREVESNRDRTSIFARAVIENMGRSTNMNENPDRNAAFQVLLTAKVPAVLIELAYVTNRADAAQLRSEDWRRNVARSIRSAIDNYFSHQGARLPM